MRASIAYSGAFAAARSGQTARPPFPENSSADPSRNWISASRGIPIGEDPQLIDRLHVAPFLVELANLDQGVFCLATRQPEQGDADREGFSAEDTQGELL